MSGFGSTDWGTVFGKVGSWAKQPENSASLIKTGGDLAGSYLQGRGIEEKARIDNQRQDTRTNADRRFDLRTTELDQSNDLFAGRQKQQDAASDAVLGAMGRSPLEFQAERMKMNAIADALEAGGPKNLRGHMAPWAQGMDMSKFRPSAAAEQPYWDAVARSSKGNFGGANLGSIYGGDGGAAADLAIGQTTAGAGQAFDAQWADHTRQSRGIIDAMYSDQDKLEAEAAEAAKKDDGGSPWWKKALQVGGGIGLAALTGGMSIPAQVALQAALGAGTGALAGGGLRGALGGAATGALGAGASRAAAGSIGGALSRQAPRLGALTGLGAIDTAGKLGTLAMPTQTPRTFQQPSRVVGNVGSR